MVDEDKGGTLDRDEVETLINFFSGGQTITLRQLDEAMAAMDDDGSGEVDFEEFVEWWKKRNARCCQACRKRPVDLDYTGPSEIDKKLKRVALYREYYGEDWEEAIDMEQDPRRVTRNQLKKMFDMVDEDKGGTLDRDEVETLINFFSGRETISLQEVEDAMAAMDDDGSGEVDFEEFVEWWKKRNAVCCNCCRNQPVDIDSTGPSEVEKKLKRIALFRQYYGENWEEAIDMDQDPADITREELKTMFNMVDEDKGGSLDRDEVETLINFFSGGRTISQQVDKAMAAMDDDGSGEVDFEGKCTSALTILRYTLALSQYPIQGDYANTKNVSHAEFADWWQNRTDVHCKACRRWCRRRLRCCKKKEYHAHRDRHRRHRVTIEEQQSNTGLWGANSRGKDAWKAKLRNVTRLRTHSIGGRTAEQKRESPDGADSALHISMALARERELQWQVRDVNDAEAELKDTAPMVVNRTRARHTRGNFLMNAQLAQKWSNTGQQRQPTPPEEPQGHDEKDDARILAPLVLEVRSMTRRCNFMQI